jgi:hypothetical protein
VRMDPGHAMAATTTQRTRIHALQVKTGHVQGQDKDSRKVSL